MIFNGKLIPLDSMEHGNITSNDAIFFVDILYGNISYREKHHVANMITNIPRTSVAGMDLKHALTMALIPWHSYNQQW